MSKEEVIKVWDTTNPQFKTYICVEEEDYGNKLLHVIVKDCRFPEEKHYGFRFSIERYPKDNIEWLGNVLASSLIENIKSVEFSMIERIQTAQRNLELALKGR